MKKRLLLASILIFLSAPACVMAEEKIAEMRFRGNFSLSDEAMIKIGGMEVGMPSAELSLESIKSKYEKTGRFEWVEIAKRYRSLENKDEAVLLITVKEKEPAKSKFMFWPILSGSDEYGLTYGLRTSAINLLGKKERLSVPLTWGGDRRAALESEFKLSNPLFKNLFLSTGVSRKKNPFFKIGDFREEAEASLQRRFSKFEFKVLSDWAHVSFGEQRNSFASIGASLALDTRQDVNLPRNAVYAGITYKRMAILGDDRRFHLYMLDLRGYKGLIGQTILAAQFVYSGADGRLPDWQRPFLGGATTLRGHEPGAYSGDNMATASLELRIPTSPLRAIYHSGFDAFWDSGAIYDHGRKLGDAKFRNGVGIGYYFLIAGFGFKVDVAHDLHHNLRAHFSTGFRF